MPEALGRKSRGACCLQAEVYLFGYVHRLVLPPLLGGVTSKCSLRVNTPVVTWPLSQA